VPSSCGKQFRALGATIAGVARVSRILLAHGDERSGQRLNFDLQRGGFEVVMVRELALLPRAAVMSSVAVLDTGMAGEGPAARRFLEGFVRGLVFFRPDLPLITIGHQPDSELSVAMARLNVDWHFYQEPSGAVLMAQVERILGEGDVSQPTLARGQVSLSLHHQRRTLEYQGVRARLTPRELKLLSLLIDEPGRVFSRDEIIMGMRPQGFVANERIVDVIVSRLRSKLVAHFGTSGAAWLRTVTGVGYALRPPAFGERPEMDLG